MNTKCWYRCFPFHFHTGNGKSPYCLEPQAIRSRTNTKTLPTCLPTPGTVFAVCGWTFTRSKYPVTLK